MSMKYGVLALVCALLAAPAARAASVNVLVVPFSTLLRASSEVQLDHLSLQIDCDFGQGYCYGFDCKTTKDSSTSVELKIDSVTELGEQNGIPLRQYSVHTEQPLRLAARHLFWHSNGCSLNWGADFRMTKTGVAYKQAIQGSYDPISLKTSGEQARTVAASFAGRILISVRNQGSQRPDGPNEFSVSLDRDAPTSITGAQTIYRIQKEGDAKSGLTNRY